MSVNTEDIKPKLLKAISKIANNENTTETKVLNEIIEEGIESRIKNKIPEYLIANKDTYNPDNDRIRKMAGIIKTKKPFKTAEAIKEVRHMEY